MPRGYLLPYTPLIWMPHAAASGFSTSTNTTVTIGPYTTTIPYTITTTSNSTGNYYAPPPLYDFHTRCDLVISIPFENFTDFPMHQRPSLVSCFLPNTSGHGSIPVDDLYYINWMKVIGTGIAIIDWSKVDPEFTLRADWLVTRGATDIRTRQQLDLAISHARSYCLAKGTP